jgi:CelD/BcsL family acetyltransferase involved in cellulose biosynthesis
MNCSVTFELDPLPDVDTLESLWRGVDRTGSHSFFVSWPWISALLQLSDGRSMLARALQGSETTGLALLTLGRGHWRKLLPIRQAWLNATGDADLDSVMIEHNGFAGTDASLGPAFVAWFAQQGFADELIVPGIDPGSVHGGRRGLFLLERRRHAYRTPLEGLGGNGVASVISSNARQQLRRSIRDYGEPLSLDRAQDAPTALAYFAALKELHVKSWTRRGRRHAFDSHSFERFHCLLIAAGTADGSVDLLRIRAGERPIGYLYNFRRNGTVSSYQSGFDDETPGLRPGYVCHALAMSHYAEAGEVTYDFLAGTNRLKQSFGTQCYELAWRHYRKPTLAFRAEHLAHRAIRFARRGAHEAAH